MVEAEYQRIYENIDEKEKNLAIASHLSVFLVFVGVPFGNVLAPLLIWRMNPGKDFVQRHAKEALNFQITMTLLKLISGALVFVLIGWPMLAVVFLVNLWFSVVASLRASKCIDYQYPVNFRFIS